MKIRRISVIVLVAGAGLLATGCVERRVVYVPAYRSPPVYQVQPAYTYSGQTAYQPVPGTVPPPSAAEQSVAAPSVSAPVPQPVTPAPAVVAPAAPPPLQVEVAPVPPGPDYVWMPGYWSWNGAWVWVGGNYVVRPRPHAVWVGGHWTRHGRGYVWIGGHWR